MADVNRCRPCPSVRTIGGVVAEVCSAGQSGARGWCGSVTVAVLLHCNGSGGPCVSRVSAGQEPRGSLVGLVGPRKARSSRKPFTQAMMTWRSD
jgi:hypothetical protein